MQANKQASKHTSKQAHKHQRGIHPHLKGEIANVVTAELLQGADVHQDAVLEQAHDLAPQTTTSCNTIPKRVGTDRESKAVRGLPRFSKALKLIESLFEKTLSSSSSSWMPGKHMTWMVKTNGRRDTDKYRSMQTYRAGRQKGRQTSCRR